MGKIKTVGELKRELDKFADDTPIYRAHAEGSEPAEGIQSVEHLGTYLEVQVKECLPKTASAEERTAWREDFLEEFEIRDLRSCILLTL